MELNEIIAQYSKKMTFEQLFLRDIAISNSGFLNFLLSFIFSTISINFIVAYIVNFNPDDILHDTISSTIFFTVIITLVIGGILIDYFKDRVKILLISAGSVVLGMFFLFLDNIFCIIGFILITFFTGIFIIDLITIIIHESTILNRGRLLGYLFFLSFITSHVIISLTYNLILIILILEILLTFSLFWRSKNYSYKETKERLKSQKKFIEIITGSLHISGYMIAIFFLALVLGNSFPIEYGFNVITPIFIFFFMSSFLIIGVLLDNLGRKWTFAAGILFISFIILFSGVLNNKAIFASIFFGISIPISFMIILTFSSDFSTERNTIRFRGRMTCSFLLVFFGGFVAGILFNFLLTQTYLKNQLFFYWIPAFLKGLSPFILIVILVWILPLPEILTAKEADWKNTLRNLYAFNTAVCLFTQSFTSGSETANLPNEDLITGGFFGILSLISEITNEQQKKLRIIDKEGVKIYFAYGKHVIFALVSTKNLPILSKKLEMFAKAFEKKFEQELVLFKGNINPFESATELITKYFK
ncbi:MAG: hypothetical protein ACTSV5_09440 [Promethearchaeota archaeon]